MSLFFKKYILRLIVYNTLSLLLLYDTLSFDQGIFSIQSLFFCWSFLLTVFFSFIETFSSILDNYETSYSIIWLGIKNLNSLNYQYISIILLNNIRYFLFFILVIFFTSFEERLIILIKKNFFKLFFLAIFIFSSIYFIKNKSFDNYLLVFKNYSQKSKYFRNDNWYLHANYKNTFNNFENYLSNNFDFEKLSTDKKNVIIIISESYPNFKNNLLSKNLLNYASKDITNLEVKIFEKNYSKENHTLAAEEFVFCNKYSDNFSYLHIEKYLLNKNCFIDKKDFNKTYIHSYRGDFFQRKERYDGFFNKLLFHEDLKKNIKECPWNDVGSCDYDIVDNLENFLSKDKKNLLIFLTLNNHVGIIADASDNFNFDCSTHSVLSISDDFCQLYKNQARFNISLNYFLKKMSHDSLVIMLGDTPPMFEKKKKKYFNEKTNIYVFAKQ